MTSSCRWPRRGCTDFRFRFAAEDTIGLPQPMRQVSVDLDAKEATVAGGAKAMDVCTAIAACGLAAVTGYTGGSKGMAGILLGGGYGALTTRFGLATDSLIAAEVVLADGQLVTADESQNARNILAVLKPSPNTNVTGAQQLAFRNAHQVD